MITNNMIEKLVDAQVEKMVIDRLHNGRKRITALKRQATNATNNGVQGVSVIVEHTNKVIAAYNKLNGLVGACNGVYGADVLLASRELEQLAGVKFKIKNPNPKKRRAAPSHASLNNDFEKAMDVLFGAK